MKLLKKNNKEKHINTQKLKDFGEMLEVLGVTKKLYYSRTEAARLLGISYGTMWHWLSQGKFDIEQVKVSEKQNNRGLIPIEALCKFCFNAKTRKNEENLMLNPRLNNFYIKLEALGLSRKLQYKPREASKILGVTPETIRAWAALGDISCILMGTKNHKRAYYPVEELMRIYEQQGNSRQ